MSAKNLAAISPSAAENIGIFTGSIIAVIILVGILIFAVVCVVKAFTHRTKGWIISGVAGALIVAIPVFVVISGLIAGFTTAGRENRAESVIESKLAVVTAGDVALPMRQQASRVTDALIYCGIAKEEACDVALRHLPGTAGWWTESLFPRLNAEKRLRAVKEVERFREMVEKVTIP